MVPQEFQNFYAAIAQPQRTAELESLQALWTRLPTAAVKGLHTQVRDEVMRRIELAAIGSAGEQSGV